MPPDIDKIGGPFPRGRRIVMVRDAERDVLFGEQPQDAWGVPAGMPEFKTVPALFRKQLEEGSKPVGVGFKVWRQLKQDWSGLVAEQRQAILKQFETVDRVLREAFPMGDEFGCLPGEDKILPVCSRQLLTASGVGVR